MDSRRRWVMREPAPLTRGDARLLAAVTWLVPAPYGDAIAGDLAETWAAGESDAHASDAIDAVGQCWGALGARVVTRHRAPLAVGAVFGACTHLGAWALWRAILAHVPLRADHPPHLAWMLGTSIVAAAIAALGWQLGSAMRARTAPPESLA